jgi:hypothetical protein
LEAFTLDLSTFIVATFCLLDDLLREELGEKRLRARGPQPTLADSEVLTIEVVAEYLGFDKETDIVAYFRRHWRHFFPALARVHRTTFTRQAANLAPIKQRLWQRLIVRAEADPRLALIDSFPVHACGFARAPRCKRFRGEAGYGRDHVLKATFYGFRLHALVCWPGLVTRLILAPANVSDVAELEALTEGIEGACLGDRNYWSPEQRAALQARGLTLHAGFKKRSRDPNPDYSRAIASRRSRIETVFSQLCERYKVKRVWARDMWHLSSRLLRKLLSHTTAFVLNQAQEHSPLRFALLLSD